MPAVILAGQLVHPIIMQKLITITILAAIGGACIAQSTIAPQPSASSQKYRAYREASTEPPFGLSRVRALVRKIKADSEDNQIMSAKDYNSLSLDEKFTYAMIHGEDFSQNCDASPPIVDEDKKIFANFPGAFGDEATWSERQRQFLHNHRTKVIELLRSTIKARHRVGVNLKQAIQELDAVELIPDLISLYSSDPRDRDILTLLMLFMKDDLYMPFLESSIYKSLYGDESNYWASIALTPTHQRTILDLASKYSKSRKH